MNEPTTVIMLTVILLNFFILGSSRLGACIRVVALQGGLLSLLPVLVNGLNGHAFLLSIGAMIIKGGGFPGCFSGRSARSGSAARSNRASATLQP